ncbi:hypothetical protein [Paracoccus ravus]|uniref:hypothetical protein n=1 Tax=Paracoccus ravus TaxID=2447760 RepID=UPI00106E2920|nr:hypothetical protein [Paracoccus ravus]
MADPSDFPKPARKRVENRGSITLKAQAFDAEFRVTLARAAMRAGKSQGQWAAEVLLNEARRILSEWQDPVAPSIAAAVLINHPSTGPQISHTEIGAKLDTLATLIYSLTVQRRRGLWPVFSAA